VIRNLRNSNLGNRHWKEISTLVKHNLQAGQTLTLKMLEDLEVFLYELELREISDRATNEAQLLDKLSEV
jgi:Dynein heavy chain, N-terminal region 2